MELVLVLIPIAFGIVGTFVAGFIWATRTGQFDDLETPAHRVLLEDSEKINQKGKSNEHIIQSDRNHVR